MKLKEVRIKSKEMNFIIFKITENTKKESKWTSYNRFKAIKLLLGIPQSLKEAIRGLEIYYLNKFLAEIKFPSEKRSIKIRNDFQAI
tara:strand:+ start:504 stop:764 length:261 start_codon:yes stop_codon:yes gene_type:complete